MVRVLDKSPADGTFVVIDEVEMEDWGIGGMPVDKFRAQQTQGGIDRRTRRPRPATDRPGESWSFRRSPPR